MSDVHQPEDASRRTFLARFTGAAVGMGALLGSWFSARSLVPNVLYEPPQRAKIGQPDAFPEGVSFIDEQRVFVFRDRNAFRVLSGVCTHLGCTVKYSPSRTEQERTVRGRTYLSKGEFQCPCHGSRFRDDGTNYAGPAPRPLRWLRVDVAPEDGQLRVDLGEEVGRDFRLVV